MTLLMSFLTVVAICVWIHILAFVSSKIENHLQYGRKFYSLDYDRLNYGLLMLIPVGATLIIYGISQL